MLRIKILLQIIFLFTYIIPAQTWIRINQLGYKNKAIKIAVLLSKDDFNPNCFELVEAITDKVVFSSNKITWFNNWDGFKKSARLDFSAFESNGSYYVQIGKIKSPVFRISDDVYNNTADFLLNYMRQQRCGYNPFLKDSCHTHDGFIIYKGDDDSTHINVIGGWHDASDYLQYVTTSANAAFQMMFAYQKNPDAFADKYDKNGIVKKNGIPDILDEAKWGIDWLLKMNPQDSIMFNQIADDRDHLGFRLPNEDKTSYGKNLERPVYFCNGKPQGIFKYKNRTNGIASTAGKFSSSFALASDLFRKFDPKFSDSLLQKAIAAYEFGKNHPGVCQTAPCKAPYFYEESNYVDDMELAAIQLYKVTNDKNYLNDAIAFGREEKVTPWMGSDSACHYQWYPFVNLGHVLIAENSKDNSTEFLSYLKNGLKLIYEKGKKNVFFVGIPFIWCSNNLVTAALTQLKLYAELSNEREFEIMEAMMRDWLFGCNPWGTSMIVGLPEYGDFPSDPHSAFSHLNNYKINGGLVDGPVYSTIFNKLIGITLYNGDEYEKYQNNFIVYHDDYGDYSTNEPTMDGTASLTFYLSSLENKNQLKQNNIYEKGAIIRGDTTKKNIALIFSGHEYADGGNKILECLKSQNVNASFFFTGDFLRNKNHEYLIKQLKDNGNYIGGHSDNHLLYCDWNNPDSLLISKQEFIADIKSNYSELAKFGIQPNDALYFLPPYEWCNNEVSNWLNQLGLTMINYTPKTFTNADYTIPSMKENYRSSKWILEKLLNKEKYDNLNGSILLIHIGTHPERTDKFYDYLNKLIHLLKEKGYSFVRIDELINRH